MNLIPILIAVGTYTANTTSEGIYILELDITKQQSRIVRTFPANNPSYLYFLNQNSVLYYVEEIGSGTVNAVKFDRNSRTFEQESSLSTQGSSPCHIALSPDKTTLIASNYSSGSFSTFALSPDGKINEKLSSYAFYASSINPNRQKQSHIHSAFYTADGQKVYVQDLGGDHIYQFEANNIGKEQSPFLTHKMPAGSGPRHLTFSNDNKFVYILNELNGSIDVYNLNDKSEILSHLQNIITDDRDGETWSAQIRLSPDGKFLYASNRADKNTISVFAVQTDGTLSLLQVIDSEGKAPRHFEFTPDGDYIIVTNQLSNNLSIFARNTETGLLTFSNMKIEIPAPVCVTLL